MYPLARPMLLHNSPCGEVFQFQGLPDAEAGSPVPTSSPDHARPSSSACVLSSPQVHAGPWRIRASASCAARLMEGSHPSVGPAAPRLARWGYFFAIPALHGIYGEVDAPLPFSAGWILWPIGHPIGLGLLSAVWAGPAHHSMRAVCRAPHHGLPGTGLTRSGAGRARATGTRR